MLSKFKLMLQAGRIETCIMAACCSLVGSLYAYKMANFSFKVCMLGMLVAILLQFVCNLANDYGDVYKGVDLTLKEIPQRPIHQNLLTLKEIHSGLFVSIVTSIVAGLLLLKFANLTANQVLFFIILGLIALVACVFYTLTDYAYGYKGFGDIFCFIFFGPVPVLGTFYLQAHYVDLNALLISASLGFLIVAVLNANNMRDYETDKAANKQTLVVKIGMHKGQIYHIILFALGFVCLLATDLKYYYLLAVPYAIWLVKQVMKRNFRANMEQTVLLIFLISILIMLGMF
jgi:1,4-dihydroxy-2-naphthoate octaprenyltransferase